MHHGWVHEGNTEFHYAIDPPDYPALQTDMVFVENGHDVLVASTSGSGTGTMTLGPGEFFTDPAAPHTVRMRLNHGWGWWMGSSLVKMGMEYQEEPLTVVGMGIQAAFKMPVDETELKRMKDPNTHEVSSRTLGGIRIKLWTDEDPDVVPDGYEWYYVLARQRDGDILVSSPIWVQDSLAVYAHSLKVSENPSEKAVNVSFHLVNLNSEKVKVNVRIQLETTWKDVAVELLGYEKRTIFTSFKEFKSGENHVKIFVNERLIQSTVHQVSYLEGPTVLVDVSHENSFQDMWTTIANDVPMKLQFSKKFFKTVPTADIVILPLPAEKGFNELKELMPFEISNLVSYVKNGGKIVIIPGDDKDHIQTYNDLLDHLGLGELVVENDKIVLRYDKDGEYKENVVFLPFQDVASLTESLLELLRGELP